MDCIRTVLGKKGKNETPTLLPCFILQFSSPISRFTKDFGQFLCRSVYEQLDIKVCNFVTFEFDLFEAKCLN